MWFVRNGDVVRRKVDFLQNFKANVQIFICTMQWKILSDCMCDCVLVVYTPYLLLVIDDMYSCW